MKTFDVCCTRRDTGAHIWSMTQAADSPAWAIAQSCVAPNARVAFVRSIGDSPEADELSMPHPGYDMASWCNVKASVIKDAAFSDKAIGYQNMLGSRRD